MPLKTNHTTSQTPAYNTGPHLFDRYSNTNHCPLTTHNPQLSIITNPQLSTVNHTFPPQNPKCKTQNSNPSYDLLPANHQPPTVNPTFPTQNPKLKTQNNSVPSPEQEIIATEETTQLQTLINRLPNFLREVTYLHYYKNLTIPQIARLINIPAPLVKNRLALSIYWLQIFIVKHKPPE